MLAVPLQISTRGLVRYDRSPIGRDMTSQWVGAIVSRDGSSQRGSVRARAIRPLRDHTAGFETRSCGLQHYQGGDGAAEQT